MEGVITFSMTQGTTLRHLNLIIDFLVIKMSLAYNMILGCPCIKMVRVVLYTYYLMMKFLIEAGMREVRRKGLITLMVFVLIEFCGYSSSTFIIIFI